jgi:dolichol-phosphate mannosyltransferase
MQIVVVLPTYNEAANLEAITYALWATPVAPRVLVVDDGSPDGTGQIAERLMQAHPGRIDLIQRGGKHGLGGAYVTGFRRALDLGADVVIQMDADFSHSPNYLPEMIDHLADYDVVVGSRYVAGGRLDERWEQGRVWLSASANLYARTLLGLRVRDVTAGFKAWRRQTLIGLDLDRIRSNGYVFQVEMAYVTQRLGYRVLEVPIYFEDRRIGHSKMSTSIKIEGIWRVWQVALRHWRLTPTQRAVQV